MKIWIKYAIGCFIGIIAAGIIPPNTPTFSVIMEYITELTLRVGRYMLLPLLFFTLTVAVFELRDTGRLLKVTLGTIVITIVTTIVLTLLGIASVILINPPRIPISVEGLSDRVELNIAANFLKLFPYSGFQALLDGSFLLPIFIFAGFAGAGCASDKTNAKPTLNLFDSLSRVCYAIICFFIDVIAVGMIAVSVLWMNSFSAMLANKSFIVFIAILVGNLIVIVCGIYPLVLKFLFKIPNPYRILYAAIAPLITAFFTGDTNLALAVSLRHAKDSLGIRRRVGSVSMTVFSIFSRSGTALITAVSFIVILKSYSSLSISFTDFLWIFSCSALFSFFLGALPSGGAFLLITILCTMYGRGFETGYLILRPAAFFIGSVATVIDLATAFFGTYLIAAHEKMVQHHEARLFI